MPRNQEKRMCTVCNQIVDTEDYAESDTGSILGIHLEQVASIPEMKNAKQLANLEPNRMYLTCGNCTDTFLRMWQMLEHVQTQKAALRTSRNGVGTGRAASMSTGNSNSLGGMPTNTVSCVIGIDNKKEQSASTNTVDLSHADADMPLNDNRENKLVDQAKGIPVEVPQSVVHRALKTVTEIATATISQLQELLRNPLGLPVLASGKQDRVFLFPPLHDTLLQKRKTKKSKNPPPQIIQEQAKEKEAPETTDEERVDFVVPHSKEEQVGVAGSSSQIVKRIIGAEVNQASEEDKEQDAEPYISIVVGKPKTSVIPTNNDNLEQGVETRNIVSRKYRKPIYRDIRGRFTRRRRNKDGTFASIGTVPEQLSGTSSSRLAVQPLSSSSSNDVDRECDSRVGAKNDSAVVITDSNSPVPSTSGLKTKKELVRPAETDEKITRKCAKHQQCCRLCSKDFETKAELKMHWIKYHRIAPEAILLMSSS